MIAKAFRRAARLIGLAGRSSDQNRTEAELLALGALLSKQQWLLDLDDINEYEFKIFSQFGDDGIIQYLIKYLEIRNKVFVEFGVGDYLESNTRFLMMNNHWSGFVMDRSEAAIDALVNQSWYWKYSLTQRVAFIDRDNVNELLTNTGLADIGLLHIDLDGNDYHVLEAIDLTSLNPAILVLEYNAVFGPSRLVSVPYEPDFDRTQAHSSNLFFGASLSAMNELATTKGYSLVGCNLAGNNAYFVRTDLLNERILPRSVDQAFHDSSFRESRHSDYSLSYLTGDARIEAIRGLKVLNVLTGELEKL